MLGVGAGRGGRAPVGFINVLSEKYLAARRPGRALAAPGGQGGVDLFGLGN